MGTLNRLAAGQVRSGSTDALGADAQGARVGQVVERLDAFGLGVEAVRDAHEGIASFDGVVGLDDSDAGLDVTGSRLAAADAGRDRAELDARSDRGRVQRG